MSSTGTNTSSAGRLSSQDIYLPPFVGKQVYLSASVKWPRCTETPLAPKLSADVASGVIAETAVGPLFIGGSVGDTGHQKWFFQLGRLF